MKTMLLRRIWFAAIAFFSAGLVLIVGAQLEDRVPHKSGPALTQTPPVVRPPMTTLNSATGLKVIPTPPIAPPIGISPMSQRPTQSVAVSPTTAAQTSVPQPIQATAQTSVQTSVQTSAQTAFGHFPYSEDTPDRLVSIGKFVRENYEREESVDRETAEAFQSMVTAARAQGVQLMGISGFRSIADQQLLFEKQIAKRGSAEIAAKVSAPPGHSEHHTGYAIDITDMSRNDVDLKVSFEETAAYQWLVTNANQYAFEQSFPQHNVQGVNYEPWHWRFVGSDRAARVFAAARA